MTDAQEAEPAPVTRCLEWRLRTIESSVLALRRELGTFLGTTGLSGDECYDLILAASEAATNAVEHAQNPTQPFFEVFADVADRRVTIIVRDHGQWLPQTPSQHRGRGLAMMRLLARTTIAAGTHGTTVTIRSHSDLVAVPDLAEGLAS